MKPPLLLLLFVAGFVSCISRQRQEGGDAKDNLEPLSVVDDSGAPSLALSNANPLIEDADQQLNSDGGADNIFQARNDLNEPNPAQTQEERKMKSSDMLSRSLRIFKFKQIPSRNKPARRPRYQSRFSVRRRPRQESKGYGAGDYNNFQPDDEDYKSDEEENNEMNEEEDYEDDEDGSYDADSNEEEEEEEEDYQPVRRPPPKRRRGKPRRGNTGRRGRYLRDLEGHEHTKRGIKSKLQKTLNSRKMTETERNKYDTSTEYSDSDDDDETRPLLRSQRKKASTSSGKDSRYADSKNITKRGFFSKIKYMLKRKKPTHSSGYQRLKTDSDEHFNGEGYDNYGYERYDTEENEETYSDASDERERLLPGKRKSGFSRDHFRGFFKRYRSKRGDLNLLERVLRNFALLSSHLKENMTQNLTTPPLGTLNEELDEDQAKEDEDEEYEEEQEEEEEEENEDENEAQSKENGRVSDEYDVQDNENGMNDEYEVEGEENESQMGAYETQNDYDAWDKQNGQEDEYEVKDGGKAQDDDYEAEYEYKGSQVDDYETQNNGYEPQEQGNEIQNGEYKSQDNENEGQSNEEDESDEDDDDESDEDDDDYDQ